MEIGLSPSLGFFFHSSIPSIGAVQLHALDLKRRACGSLLLKKTHREAFFNVVFKVGKLRHGAGMGFALPFLSWGLNRTFHAALYAIMAKIKATAWLPRDTCAAPHPEKCHPPLRSPNLPASPFFQPGEK